MYQKVLVPVSAKYSGARANKALAHAAKICDGEIVLLHVAPAPSAFAGETTRQLKEKEAQVEGMELLAPSLAALSEAGIKYRTRVSMGQVEEIIVNVAEEEQVELVVMFTDGRDSVKDILFGSITERVLNMTELPILVVRQ